MKAYTYPDIPNIDIEPGLTNLFHGLLAMQANQQRKEIIEEVYRTSEDSLERNNRLARLRNLGQI